MHTTVDYSNSPSAAFDAIEDIKQWFGQAKWDEISPMFSKLKNVQRFTFYAEFSGVQGFPVKAWYELYNGQGSWDKAWAEVETEA